MKKITAAVLLSILLATLSLASCQNADGGTDNTAGISSDGTEASEPPGRMELKNELASFESLDLDGNAVTGDIFAVNKLTMVNIWGTRCPYCIDEMPDLAKLSDDYADRGFAILGIISNVVSDGRSIDETNAGDARYIIEETGVNYTNIVVTENVYNLFLSDVSAIPTTIFVDENGNKVGKTFLGAKSYDEWADIIESLLEEVG
jgi:thiol-disulfide isomerase/thioredoxin